MSTRHTPRRALALVLPSLLLGTSLGALAACASPRSSEARAAAGADSVYVGIAATKSTATYFRGVTLALERLNRERPAGSRPFAIRYPPDTQPTQVAVAAFFRDDPRVVAVVGHTGSQQTMEAAPVYADVEHGGRRALAAVSPTATNPMVTRLNAWVFRVCPTDDDAARALARYAVDSMRVRRLAVLYRNDLFGRGFTRVVVPALQAGGVTVVETDPYLAKITEFRAYAQRMAARQVDALLVAGGGMDGADMIRALRAAGVDPRVLGTDDMSSLVTGTPAQAEFRGVRFASFFDARRVASDEGRSFVADYERRFGQFPNHQAALAYDAALLIGRATLAVGPDRARVRDWIAASGPGHAPVVGITGPLRFDGRGDAVDKTVLVGRVE